MPHTHHTAKDTYDLYVVFGGLGAWVPRTAEAGQAGTVEVGATLVLPRIDEDVSCPTASRGDLPPHRPRLTRILGTCHGGGGGDQPADHLDKKLLRRLRKLGKKVAGFEVVPGAWDLRRETVAFGLPNSTSQPYVRTRGLCGFAERCPEDRVGLVDWSWIASMAEVCHGIDGLKGVEQIDPACVSGQGAIHRRVGALVEVRSGSLMTMNLSEHDGETLPYRFRRASGGDGSEHPFHRAMTDSVVLHVTVSDPQDEGVRILRKPFPGADPSDEGLPDVTLHPQEIFGRRVIVLHVATWPDAHSAHSHRHQEWNDPIHHFEVFYELSKKLVPKEERLIPYVPRKEGMRSFGYAVPGASMESKRMARQAIPGFHFVWKKAKQRRRERKLVKSLMATVSKRPICPETQFESVGLS